MPAPSKISQLPEPIREELHRRLIANGFSGYEALSEWLESEGFEISKSAVGRAGKDFKDRLSALKTATEQAKAIVAESPDDEGAMSEALMRLIQERMFGILLEMDVDPSKVNINSLGRTIAELGRASVSQKKFMQEVRDRAQAAAADVEAIAKEGGLSDDRVALIKARFLNVVPQQ